MSLATLATLTVIPAAALLYVPGVFSWWLGAAYLLFVGIVFIDRYTLMLHNTSHRPLFCKRARWLNAWIPVVLGPFFGQSPNTYFAHHVGMHHQENNLEADLSSTMRFERDNALHFARYFARFFFLVVFELPAYFWREGRPRLARRALFGELVFFAWVVTAMMLNWRATLCVFVAPYVLMRLLMMAGNWGQHAFIDPARPADDYANSTTCINTRYNRRCFNDGYHTGHHLRPTRHWTEMPDAFERDLAEYGSRGALVFDGIDFFGIWARLMLRDYHGLARHVVALDGRPTTHDEIKALLRARTRPCPVVVQRAAPAE